MSTSYRSPRRCETPTAASSDTLEPESPGTMKAHSHSTSRASSPGTVKSEPSNAAQRDSEASGTTKFSLVMPAMSDKVKHELAATLLKLKQELPATLQFERIYTITTTPGSASGTWSRSSSPIRSGTVSPTHTRGDTPPAAPKNTPVHSPRAPSRETSATLSPATVKAESP